jgi:hypothetical protein
LAATSDPREDSDADDRALSVERLFVVNLALRSRADTDDSPGHGFSKPSDSGLNPEQSTRFTLTEEKKDA